MARRTFTLTAVIETELDEDDTSLMRRSRIAVEQALAEALPDGVNASVYVILQP